MALALIGAGLGRTGTSSLQRALERLGLRCYHSNEMHRRTGDYAVWARAIRGEAVDWDGLFAGYDAAVDWPTAMFWRELTEYYPAAKVVLTVREADAWYDSYDATVRKAVESGAGSDDLDSRVIMGAAKTQLLDGLFEGRFDDREAAKRAYRVRNDRIRAAVPADRLLVTDSSQGWRPLCEFLGRPVPGEPYPHTNTRGEFWRTILGGHPRVVARSGRR